MADRGPGWTLTLNRDLVVPSEKSRAYIQGGRVVAENDVAIFEPNCNFFLYRSMNDLHGERTIAKGEFTVINMYQRREMSFLPWWGPRNIAQLWDLSYVDLVTHIELFNEEQVGVTKLLCSRFSDPHYLNFLTIEEIRRTLSPVVTW